MVQRSNKPAAIPVSPGKPAPYVDFSQDNSRVTATLTTGESIVVLLHGATVISWKSAGKENLFVSEKAILDGTKPVRGGIPLVFPFFGAPPSSGPLSTLPQHGFARSSRWEFLNKSTSESESESTSSADNNVKLDFGLSSTNLDGEVRKAWPYDFALIYSVTLAQDSLKTTLCVRNEGSESFDFQMLLHTYLHVKDISQTTVTGLGGSSYIDKVKGSPSQKETEASLSIAAEVDRIYSLSDPEKRINVLEAWKPSFEILRENLDDVVVWNPWIEKSATLKDFGPKDGWKQMICVEVGAVSGWQKLEAGDTFEGGQIIKSQI